MRWVRAISRVMPSTSSGDICFRTRAASSLPRSMRNWAALRYPASRLVSLMKPRMLGSSVAFLLPSAPCGIRRHPVAWPQYYQPAGERSMRPRYTVAFAGHGMPWHLRPRYAVAFAATVLRGICGHGIPWHLRPRRRFADLPAGARRYVAGMVSAILDVAYAGESRPASLPSAISASAPAPRRSSRTCRRPPSWSGWPDGRGTLRSPAAAPPPAPGGARGAQAPRRGGRSSP